MEPESYCSALSNATSNATSMSSIDCDALCTFCFDDETCFECRDIDVGDVMYLCENTSRADQIDYDIVEFLLYNCSEEGEDNRTTDSPTTELSTMSTTTTDDR